MVSGKFVTVATPQEGDRKTVTMTREITSGDEMLVVSVYAHSLLHCILEDATVAPTTDGNCGKSEGKHDFQVCHKAEYRFECPRE